MRLWPLLALVALLCWTSRASAGELNKTRPPLVRTARAQGNEVQLVAKSNKSPRKPRGNRVDPDSSIATQAAERVPDREKLSDGTPRRFQRYAPPRQLPLHVLEKQAAEQRLFAALNTGVTDAVKREQAAERRAQRATLQANRLRDKTRSPRRALIYAVERLVSEGHAANVLIDRIRNVPELRFVRSDDELLQALNHAYPNEKAVSFATAVESWLSRMSDHGSKSTGVVRNLLACFCPFEEDIFGDKNYVGTIEDHVKKALKHRKNKG